MRNLKLALRVLLKTPFVTGIAILSLGLGIGANAAIFSMFDQLLRRPLPVPQPSRLVNLSAPGPMQGSTSCSQAGSCQVIFSYPMYRDLENAQTVFTGIAAHRDVDVSLAVHNEPLTGEGMMVSGSYFPVLGIVPAKGRFITPEDDKVIGANFVAVISHFFWTNNFGADPNVVGQTLAINGKTFTIIGVAPDGFEGTTVGTKPFVYVPITMRGQLERFARFDNRKTYWIYAFARLKDGVTIDAAQNTMNVAYQRINRDVDVPLQQGFNDKTMEAFRNKRLIVEPGAHGQSSINREASTPIAMLFAVTGIVLLIACANIANLLLARGAGRSAEMGVRLALGATRKNLVGQLMTESVMLSLIGGAVSLVIAKITLNAIQSMLPPEAVATLQFGISVPVMIFAGALSLVTGVVFGLFPAMHSTRTDLIKSIRAGAGQLAGGKAATRFRTSLVTAQIALSMGLLIMSALFLKSLRNVSQVDLGLKVDNISTFAMVPQRAGYDSARSAIFFTRMEQELAGLPGVTSVTDAMVPLLSGSNWGTDVKVQGFLCTPDNDCNSRYNEIGIDYFKTFGVTLLAGREFNSGDAKGSHDVAIVNRAFAKKFNMGDNVVGKFMSTGGDSLNTEIVGFVGDVKYSDVKDSIPPVFYIPWRQDARTGRLFFYVRASVPPEQMLGTMRSVAKRVDPNLPVEELKTMPQQVRENVFLDRMISTLSGAFALLATLLAGVGLYGVLSYSVQQRTREIGVRIALGASGANVRGLVLRQVGVMIAIGGVIGIAGALGLGRAAKSLLYQLQGHDPVAFGLSVVLLTLVAFGAAFVPARRAAQVDPMRALRYD